MKNEEKKVKDLLIAAIDELQTTSISTLCRRVGVARSTFYFHYQKDSAFRKEFLIKQQHQLMKKIVAA